MKPIQVYLTSKEHQELKVLAAQEGTTLSALIRSALGLDEIKQPTPIKREVKESPPVIRNLAEVIEEGEELYGTPRYDKAKPFWSPFGPLPVRQNLLNPNAVVDPNYDDERQMPLDVAKRNAYIERDE
jgi:hypothetical protein